MYAEAADTTLHYDLRGSGPRLVVLTHGLGSDLEYWTPHLEQLAAHHRVLRWDLRGAGASAKPPGPYDPALFARDLAVSSLGHSTAAPQTPMPIHPYSL